MAVADQIKRKVELRKIEHSEGLSEETNCFAADIFIDGKKVGDVKDDGRGGEMMVHPHTCLLELNKIGAAMGKCTVEWSKEPQDIDGNDIIGKLLDEWLLTKDYKKLLRGNKITFIDKGEIYSLKAKPKDEAEKNRLIAAVRKETPGAIFFNELSEQDGLNKYLELSKQSIGWKFVKAE